MKSSNWSRENIAWLAGILEGEGCFAGRESGLPFVAVNMTDKDVIYRCREISGLGQIYKPTLKNMRHKQMWSWKITNSYDAYALICAVYQFMFYRRSGVIKDSIDRFIKSGPYKSHAHGYRASYKKGCRCHPCKDAQREYNKKRTQLG